MSNKEVNRQEICNLNDFLESLVKIGRLINLRKNKLIKKKTGYRDFKSTQEKLKWKKKQQKKNHKKTILIKQL